MLKWFQKIDTWYVDDKLLHWWWLDYIKYLKARPWNLKKHQHFWQNSSSKTRVFMWNFQGSIHLCWIPILLKSPRFQLELFLGFLMVKCHDQGFTTLSLYLGDSSCAKIKKVARFFFFKESTPRTGMTLKSYWKRWCNREPVTIFEDVH